MALPPLLSVPEIQNRLQIIFPEGTANRNFVILVKRESQPSGGSG